MLVVLPSGSAAVNKQKERTVSGNGGGSREAVVSMVMYSSTSSIAVQAAALAAANVVQWRQERRVAIVEFKGLVHTDTPETK